MLDNKSAQVGQVPGTVTTLLAKLEIALSKSQLHRVSIVCAGPVCAYTGNVVLHDKPPSMEYSKVLPTGQLVLGAEMLPPLGVPPTVVQVLFTIIAEGAVTVVKPAGHESGHSGVVKV